ncbi:MAG: ATP-dependent RecD-like DNA helicase [Lachnospiraceae bacterium]|nr:ATP-dependent RecD-like DNA helicase [Lachnospiraceae bacterium]MDD7026982.1 ATP-dependent RecD-like DNA helicase [Lachnospiraceae bacterium]
MEFRGYVDHIIYRKPENGYTVFVLSTKEEDITCVGYLQQVDQGENLLIQGEEVEHALYGTQIKVSSYQIVLPDDSQSMERYLGSGAIKGVGPALARRIIGVFGEDTFRIIEEEPERLTEVKGISERIAREISTQMEEKKDMRQAMLFLQQYGISHTLAVRIYETYGAKTLQVIRENPYQLAEDVHGIGFRMSDEIAFRMGIRTDSDFRIRSGILYTLLLASVEGHAYLPKEILLRNTSIMLELKPEQIELQLSNLAMDKKVVIKTDGENIFVYAWVYYYAELNCARMLSDIDSALEVFSKDEEEGEPGEAYRDTVLKKIVLLEEKLNIHLDELQRQAVLESVLHGVFILTGGPGTGKTTTINMLISYYEQEGMDIFLAAPTGRAAKRMSEATGFEARTIHRLLELNGGLEENGKKAGFTRKEDNPLEADVVIIDEMSMVDIHLFQALLKAIAPGTRLILVGDVNQLPSVGPGQVLQDLISSEAFSVVRLEKIFRQAKDSDIVVNAHKIHQGERPVIDNKSKDFFFLERNDVNVIYKHMIQLIQEKLPGYCHIHPFEIQVLTPMRKGNLGVETLNRILQRYLNPESKQKEEYLYGDNIFRVGDKVMQVKNNYQLEWEIVSKYNIPIDKGVGVFNGDMGIIREIHSYNQTLVVEFDDMRRVIYPFSGLEELELAYAITIHKSQGSEYPAVLLPLLKGPRQLLNRNLLYTGVTRAKSCLTILGSSETLAEMVANENESRRYTGLSLRIREVEGR